MINYIHHTHSYLEVEAREEDHVLATFAVLQGIKRVDHSVGNTLNLRALDGQRAGLAALLA